MTCRKFAGFTLIELMVVLVIIAIVAAIAYPSYQDSLRKSKRAEGRAALMKAAQVEERFFSDRNQYATQKDLATGYGIAGVTTDATVIYSGDSPNLASGAYTITVNLPTTTTFELKATPNAPFVDTDCGNLTLDNFGKRGWATGTHPERCKW